jgi:hypothetical protein
MVEHILLFGGESAPPPGPLGFPALNIAAIQPDEAEITLLRPRGYAFRFRMVHILRGPKRSGGAEQQARTRHTDPYYVLRECKTSDFPLLRRPCATHHNKQAQLGSPHPVTHHVIQQGATRKHLRQGLIATDQLMRVHIVT